jgi:CheY-like chemotaxis protein
VYCCAVQASRTVSVYEHMKPATQKRAEPAAVGLVLADGHPIVLQGMQRLFQAEDDLAVLATCTSDAEAIDAIHEHKPHVLMLDLRLPRRGGLAVLRDLAPGRLPMRVVLLATAISETEMVDAVRLGVSGVVLRKWRRGSSCSASGRCMPEPCGSRTACLARPSSGWRAASRR